MSLIRDPRIIFERMISKKIRLYQVFDSDKKSVIDECDLDDDLSPEEAARQLEETLSGLDGLVHVVIRIDSANRKRGAESTEGTAKIDTYKGIYKYSLKLGDSQNSGNSSGFPTGGNLAFVFSLLKENAALETRLIEEKYKRESEFNDRIKQLEDKLNKKVSSESSKMEEYLATLIENVLTRLK